MIPMKMYWGKLISLYSQFPKMYDRHRILNGIQITYLIPDGSLNICSSMLVYEENYCHLDWFLFLI